MSTHEPGTVAVATVRGVPNVRVIRFDDEEVRYWQSGHYVKGDRTFKDREVTEVRRLVTLDLAAAPFADSNSLADLIDNLRSDGTIMRDWVADQIEAQTRPPKPEEPTGLGAVVEDEAGDVWVHDRDPRKPGYLGVEWLNVRTQAHRHYESINAVRVLSEGVTA